MHCANWICYGVPKAGAELGHYEYIDGRRPNTKADGKVILDVGQFPPRASASTGTAEQCHRRRRVSRGCTEYRLEWEEGVSP